MRLLHLPSLAIVAALVCLALGASAAPVETPAWLAALDLTPYTASLICAAAYEESRLVKNGAGQTHLLPTGADAPFAATPYDLHGVIHKGNTEMLVLWHPAKHVLVLAFRGTSSIGDAIDDLKVAPVPWPFGGDGMTGIKVHDGFSTQYAAVRPEIVAALGRHQEAKHVVTMGHSLGAAISSLAAVDAALALPAVAAAGSVHSVTFGSPRPGSEAFVARYRALVANTLRFVNEDHVCIAKNPLAKIQRDACRDKVTQVPPAGKEYAHVTDAPTVTAVDTGVAVHIGPGFELRLHSLSTYEAGTFDPATAIHEEL